MSSDIRDAMVNILGFIPFAFFLCLRFRANDGIWPRYAIWYALLGGAATSFTFEVTQVLLPTRDSSALDLINNIAGTLAGSLLARFTSVHKVPSQFYQRLKKKQSITQ